MFKKFGGLALGVSLLSLTACTHNAQGPETILVVKPQTITVNGKTAEIYTIQQPDGAWGYSGVTGQEFNALVENKTDVPITLHWHGLIVPSDQDGVPYVSQAPIAPGASYHYHFKLKQSGTYWMHSHYGLQMQQGLYAPLIIEDPQDPYKDAQNVVMLVSDFSFKSPAQINYDLTHAPAMDMKGSMPGGHMGMMAKHAPDLNDVDYDAYLTNYHTLQQPETVAVSPGRSVRLRIINGASASTFFINLGKLSGTVIAADGEAIKPVQGSVFGISEGQRLDILLRIPAGAKDAYPVLAEAEGTHQQTGLILITPGAVPPAVPETVPRAFGAINPLQDTEFHALQPLPEQVVSKQLTVTLQGDMSKYVWKINNQVWPNITPMTVHKGDRVAMRIVNQTGMAHPMHLHGHVFEVTAVNGKPISDGPMRDTVLVPANGSVTIEFDADNPGNWMFHCHVIYHAEDGMMSIIQYEGTPNPPILAHQADS